MVPWRVGRKQHAVNQEQTSNLQILFFCSHSNISTSHHLIIIFLFRVFSCDPGFSSQLPTLVLYQIQCRPSVKISARLIVSCVIYLLAIAITPRLFFTLPFHIRAIPYVYHFLNCYLLVLGFVLLCVLVGSLFRELTLVLLVVRVWRTSVAVIFQACIRVRRRFHAE